jgi:ammonia channel protein AmtB
LALFYKTTPHGREAAGGVAGLIHGNATLLKWQFLAALWVICWTGAITWILLKLVGVFVPLRMSEKNMEIGDVAEHGHEVYPSDVPSLGYPGGIPGVATGAGQAAEPSAV